MKISCIALNSNMLAITEQTNIINYIKNKLYEIGETFSSISYFDNSLETLKSHNLFENNLLFIIGTKSSVYNHNIKDNISRLISERMETNNNCYSALNKYCTNHNIVFSVQEEMEVKIPTNSIPLCYEYFYNNGFMYKYNDTYIVFLPAEYNFVEFNYTNYISPLVNDITDINCDIVTLKCFGILEKDIKALISDIDLKSKLQLTIVGDNLDSSIHIKYLKNQDNSEIQNLISEICSKLNKYIYSTENTDIYQMASDLLNLRGKHLVLGETITYGNINRKLSVIDLDIVSDAYTFNNYNSIINTLGIDKKILDKYGHYSVNTVYELANLLLEKSKAQIVMFLLGDKNADICYMAIGDINGIHVYKNKINTKDDNLISNLSKTAIFYLIKKLKQNDLLM